VVGDRDQDREALAEVVLDELQDGGRVRREERVDQYGVVAAAEGEARDLLAELARVPLRVPRGPAPEVLGQLLGRLAHGRRIITFE
jgi:hypothetical protein